MNKTELMDSFLSDQQRNEILMVKHLEETLVNGLTGRNHKGPLYEAPLSRVLAGVIFPEGTFAQDTFSIMPPITDNEEESDDVTSTTADVQPSRRLVSMGLEFRASPPADNSPLQLEVSARFALYVRLFPTLEEQRRHDAISGFAEQEDEETAAESQTAKEVKSTHSSELRELAPKYRRIEVNIPTFTVEIGTESQDGALFEVREPLANAILMAREQVFAKYGEELFSVKETFSEREGKRPRKQRQDSILVPGPWENEQDRIESLRKIRTSPSLPDWQAVLQFVVEPDTEGDPSARHIIAALINKTPYESSAQHPLEFYDVQLRVKVISGELLPMRFSGISTDYRVDPTTPGLGIGCVAVPDGVNALRTEVIPRYFQLWYRTRDEQKVPFKKLADDPIPVLKQIHKRMLQYLDRWDNFLSNHSWEDEKHKAASLKDRQSFQQEINTFALGLTALQRDQRLLKAFRLMNQVFAASGQRSKPVIDSWRLFQIVYIVRLLPSLAAREFDDPSFLDQLLQADVLWFPTGGGKTEAYLGLIVCALFYDRLRGKSRGTTAWLRFPLRMLSKQQLERLARVLAQAEILRRTTQEMAESQRGEPFSMGYFVGGGNTPNFVSERQMQDYLKDPDRLRADALVLHYCPFCRSKTEMKVDTVAWRLQHCCTNPDCYVTKEMDGVLPVYVTDSEVYRYLPSVLCGTVDKLASLGRWGEFSHIFGQVNGYCPDHGYFSTGECLEKITGSRSCKVRTNQYHKVQPVADPTPALIIQDELHLVKEELGTFNGHYEGFVTKFAKKIGNGKPPKILAATATIEHYEEHIHHVYMRPAARFPVPGFQAGENFYATIYPEVPRRLYIGLLSHLRSKEETIERCLEIYHTEIQRLYSLGVQGAVDLGLVGLNDEESWRRFLGLYDLSVVYVNQKATGADIDYRINHALNRRLSAEHGFTITTQILTGDDPMEKVGDVIDRIEADLMAPPSQKLHSLIATSMISHGVDLARINAMFLCGMPSRFAEYIQATSRSARSHAGLVLISFNGQDVREQSQYRYFMQNHKYLNHLVDPVPVHRFAQNAIRRTMPGLLIGLLTCVYARNPKIWAKYKSRMEKARDIQKILPNEETDTKLITWDQLLHDLLDIYGVNDPSFPTTMRQLARKEIETQFQQLRGTIMRAAGDLDLKSEDLLNPLSSFRDIDVGIEFRAELGTAIIENRIGS